ncbi:hypothetical protein STEG23_010336 [Scotinomys teguina]
MGPVFVSILLTCVFLLVGKIFFNDFVEYVFCAFELVFSFFIPIIRRVTGCSWVLGSNNECSRFSQKYIVSSCCVPGDVFPTSFGIEKMLTSPGVIFLAIIVVGMLFINDLIAAEASTTAYVWISLSVTLEIQIPTVLQWTADWSV